MKKMTALLAAVMMLALCACGASQPQATESPVSSMALNDIVDGVYANLDIELPELMTVEINAENQQMFLGTTDLEFVEGVASEPMISAIPYSLCFVRFADEAAAAAAKDVIAGSVDPRKWICVEVPADKVRVEQVGNVVGLFMMEQSDEVYAAFEKAIAG